MNHPNAIRRGRIEYRNIPEYKIYCRMVDLIGASINKACNKTSKYSWTKHPKKKLYYLKVWYYTEKNDLSSLENYTKRGYYTYHLDHIIPINYGYLNNMSPKYIGNISNLKFIPHKDNMLKGCRV